MNPTESWHATISLKSLEMDVYAGAETRWAVSRAANLLREVTRGSDSAK